MVHRKADDDNPCGRTGCGAPCHRELIRRSTIDRRDMATRRPGRELHPDGWSRASSPAGATNTSATFGIYRGAGASRRRKTSTPTSRSSRAWPHPGPPPWCGAGTPIRSASCAPGTTCLRSWGARHQPRPLDRCGRGHLPDGISAGLPEAGSHSIAVGTATGEWTARAGVAGQGFDEGCAVLRRVSAPPGTTPWSSRWSAHISPPRRSPGPRADRCQPQLRGWSRGRLPRQSPPRARGWCRPDRPRR